MDAAYIALIVLAAVYIPIWVWVRLRPERAARWHLEKYGPCIMIKTSLGLRAMDRIASRPRFWHAFGFFSKVVSAVLFLLMMYMLVVAVLAIPSTLASGSSIGIEYALAIPGFNPIMPLTYGVVALVIAMAVHEMGHGIQARVNGIGVKSSGLLYGVVPLGAFVEQDEEDMKKADRKAQMDVYTAGISVNTVVAVLSMAVMVLACGCVSSDHGDSAGVYYVDAESPAYAAGIPSGALIIGVTDSDGKLTGENEQGEVNGTLTTVTSGGVAYIDYEFDPTERYEITYLDDGVAHTATDVQMGMFVKSVASGSPADEAGIEPGVFIGYVVYGGETYTISSPYDFSTFVSLTSGGDEVTLGIVESGGTEATETTVTLASNGSIGYLGVSSTTGGMTLVTPNIMLDMATDPFYGADSAYSYVTSFFSYLSGPFNGMDPISDDIKWWYDAPGGDVFWMFVTLLYWIFWLDILLAISNALPTYVLDGGFIFAGGVSWLLEKLRIEDEGRRKKLTESIAGSVSTLTLFLFMVAILAMIL